MSFEEFWPRHFPTHRAGALRIAIASWLACACVGVGVAQSMPPAPAPSPASHPQVTRVRAGHTFQIALTLHGGTGYTWAPRTPLSSGLKLLRTSSASLHPGLPGGRLRQLLVFRESSAGRFTLTVQLIRPWEHWAAPAKTISFTIAAYK